NGRCCFPEKTTESVPSSRQPGPKKPRFCEPDRVPALGLSNLIIALIDDPPLNPSAWRAGGRATVGGKTGAASRNSDVPQPEQPAAISSFSLPQYVQIFMRVFWATF